MSSTKQRILKSAIGLFNQRGLVNVRLQQIADDTGISVGNLAYHYYSKKAIVLAIDSELGEELELLLSIDQNFPSLIDFDNHLGRYFFLLNRYSFYFLDLLEIERAYPKMHAKRVDYVEKMIAQIYEWLLLNVEKGVLKPEKGENHYQHIAESIWMIITFWLTQRQVRGKEEIGEGHFKEFIWNQLFPLFTDSGWMECEAFILPQLKYYSEAPDSLDFRNLT